MKLSIDLSHRYACMRAHTATHLLHAELTKIFPQTKQAGSYVGPDELRFDFFAERGLTSEELDFITAQVNHIISANEKVSVQEMSYDQALKTGAKAFFEDSYPEIVRVVSVWYQGNTSYSVELCGGTHVAETGQIGAFVIIEQGAVAAGVKRITALTGPKVAAYVGQLQSQIDGLAHKVWVPTKQLEAKIEKILAESDEMSTKIEQLSAGLIKSIIWKLGQIESVSCDAIWSYEDDIALLGLSFADAVNTIKSIAQERSWLMVSATDQYALSHKKAKVIVKELGLKGGGSDTFVQGKDENIVKSVQLKV